MNVPILVVARNGTTINKFAQSSLQGAFNIRDFLEETGEYNDVSIFQRVGVFGPLGEWVQIEDVEC